MRWYLQGTGNAFMPELLFSMSLIQKFQIATPDSGYFVHLDPNGHTSLNLDVSRLGKTPWKCLDWSLGWSHGLEVSTSDPPSINNYFDEFVYPLPCLVALGHIYVSTDLIIEWFYEMNGFSFRNRDYANIRNPLDISRHDDGISLWIREVSLLAIPLCDWYRPALTGI